MENDSTCDCVNKVMAMIPMPVPGLAEEFARKACAWKVPTDIVAIAIIEMLLGTDRTEWVDQRVRRAREDLVNAFTSNRGVEDFKAAAEVLSADYDLDIWRNICAHFDQLNLNPNSAEAHLLFRLFRSGHVLDAASAERYVLEQRNTPAAAPAPIAQHDPGAPRPGG